MTCVASFQCLSNHEHFPSRLDGSDASLHGLHANIIRDSNISDYYIIVLSSVRRAFSRSWHCTCSLGTFSHNVQSEGSHPSIIQRKAMNPLCTIVSPLHHYRIEQIIMFYLWCTSKDLSASSKIPFISSLAYANRSTSGPAATSKMCSVYSIHPSFYQFSADSKSRLKISGPYLILVVR